MYIMNKVRKTRVDTMYEIVSYDIKEPNIIKVNNISKGELQEYLNHEDKDFRETNGILITTAETIEGGLSSSFNVKLGDSLFTLLLELCAKQAFYIPQREWEENTKEEVLSSSFHNLKINNNNMNISISILKEDSWQDYNICYYTNNNIYCNPFYLAIPSNTKLETINLELIDTRIINNINCNIYYYNNDLPSIPKIHNLAYFPLPIFNYLNYGACSFDSALTYLNDLADYKNITTVNYQDSNLIKTKDLSVSISSSLNVSNKDTRLRILKELSKNTDLDGIANSDVFSNLNILDSYAVKVLSCLDLADPDIRFKASSSLKKEKCKHELVLMQFRYILLDNPYLFSEQETLQCRGGGGGDSFFTFLTKTNINNKGA